MTKNTHRVTHELYGCEEAYDKRLGGDRYCADANSHTFPPRKMMRLFRGEAGIRFAEPLCADGTLN
jgi:hypothetical protein